MTTLDAFTWERGLAYKPLRTERDVNRTGFSQRLELRQSQALVMTPQLQQAIKMLQLSNLELTQFVDAEIQQNPLLERREAGLEQAAPANGGSVAESPASERLEETVAGEF